MVSLCLAIKLETQCSIWYKGSTLFYLCHCLVLSMEIVASSRFGLYCFGSGLHMTRVLSAMFGS